MHKRTCKKKRERLQKTPVEIRSRRFDVFISRQYCKCGQEWGKCFCFASNGCCVTEMGSHAYHYSVYIAADDLSGLVFLGYDHKNDSDLVFHKSALISAIDQLAEFCPHD